MWHLICWNLSVSVSLSYTHISESAVNKKMLPNDLKVSLSPLLSLNHTYTHTHTHTLLSANPQIHLHKYDTEQRSGEEGEDEGEHEHEHKDASPVAGL